MSGPTDTAAITKTVLRYFEGWQGMLERTESGKGRADAADGRIDVVVDDVYEDMAGATVHTATYHEYVHLVRTGDGWGIANVLWQLT